MSVIDEKGKKEERTRKRRKEKRAMTEEMEKLSAQRPLPGV